MRRRIRRTMQLIAVAVLAGFASVPVAKADPHFNERAGDVDIPQNCRDWNRAINLSLAYYGIFGAQAESYIASRLDNPCGGRPYGPRSLFHAGDPA
jgi:hypothetical protein